MKNGAEKAMRGQAGMIDEGRAGQYGNPPRAPHGGSRGGSAVRMALAILALAALSFSAWVSYSWLSNRPRAMRRPPSENAPLVQVISVEPSPQVVAIRAMGTVQPSSVVDLVSQVGGRVVEVSPSFIPGGRIQKGQMLLKVDPRDYEIAVRQAEQELHRRLAELAQRSSELQLREADVIKAKSELTLERGRQAVARREYELLGKKLSPQDRALVLRQPQLESAEASYEAAQAAKAAALSAKKAAEASVASAREALRKANIELERTVIRAPFNCVVQSKDVDVGSFVTPGQRLGSLAGTDVFWVTLSVAASDLGWMRIPGFNSREGSPVRIFYEAAWGRGAYRWGKVVKLLPALEPRGRMARVLVEVTDPLDLGRQPKERHPLLLDAYVSAEVLGRQVDRVIKLRRAYLRDGDRVWVMTPGGTLEIRPVSVVWADRDHVFIRDGLGEGDLVITSELAVPVPGMRLRRVDSKGDENPIKGPSFKEVRSSGS